MRAIIQRVSEASVTIDEKMKSSINSSSSGRSGGAAGLLVFIGIEDSDTKEDIDWLAAKIINLRIFNDANGVMNLSVKDICGDVIIVSQFTLHASSKKGNRPSYIRAAKPEVAIPIYNNFISQTEVELGKPVQTGIFGADMKVKLINEGPVTIIIDTKNKE